MTMREKQAADGPVRVFISYSHDSPEHTKRVLGLANALRSQGVDAELDQYHTRPPQGWSAWCEEQLRPENSEFVLLICTETYRKRVENQVPVDEGRGVYWEGRLIYRYLYNEKQNKRFIPILFPGTREEDIPAPLWDTTRYRLEHFDLSDAQYEAFYRELTCRPATAKPKLGRIVPLPVAQVRTNFLAEADHPIDISRILKYAPAELIGREEETKLLKDAWAKVRKGAKTRPHVLTFVALGGEGKTALAAKWAAELAAQDWPGCDAAFAWSFYSQGTREQQAASSDLFLKEALTFFGDDKTASSAEHASEKAKKLAALVGQRRSLLILDGLEPLQYPTEAKAFQPGTLRDDGIAKLLKGLATASQGLCIVTTRIGVPDLDAFKGSTVIEEELKRLSRLAGVELLKRLGVIGSERRTISLKDGDEKTEKVNEFEKLVEDVKGHALTLTLLGGFLKRAFHGDIRQRDRVKFEKADEKMDGGHAFRTLAAYEQWLLRDGGEEGRREVAVLRLMGLFDRPADGGCLAALRREPIPGLTESLDGLTDDEWEFCLTGLENTRLLTVHRDTACTLVSLDAHPHIREYFTKQLREESPDAWRAAHRRLYEHLCQHKEGDQPTLEDLQPLYQAVAHGCQAGLQQEACDNVYLARLLRHGEDYSAKRLAAVGSDLGAAACFFEQPWSRISPALTEADQAWLLSNTAFYLRALGRLTESLEPMRAGVQMGVSQKNWSEAGIRASNLSELELTLGEVAGAVGDAEQSVTYADRSGDAFQRLGKRTTHADALHQAGRRPEAQTRFREAEQMQQETQPDYPLLYGLAGFRYCDLLLATSERAAWHFVLNPKFEIRNWLSRAARCESARHRRSCGFCRGRRMFSVPPSTTSRWAARPSTRPSLRDLK
ncbi:MAG: SEFIR domain-containing protein [Phycisphaerales bacterium]